MPSGEAVADLAAERSLTPAGAVLVVDQLEELAGADPGERTAYLELVADWAETGLVVLTLRSDRLDVLTASPRLAKLPTAGCTCSRPWQDPSCDGSSSSPPTGWGYWSSPDSSTCCCVT